MGDFERLKEKFQRANAENVTLRKYIKSLCTLDSPCGTCEKPDCPLFEKVSR